MIVQPVKLLNAAAALVALVALSACGGGASRHDATSAASVGASQAAAAPSVGAVAEPNAVVVRIGGHVITKAMFAHALAVEEKSEGSNYVLPVPPDFAACIAHLRVAPVTGTSTSAKPSVAELKRECQGQYQALISDALDPLIVDQWVIGGAAEAGVSVSQEELEQVLKRAEGKGSLAQIVGQLRAEGRTLEDFLLELKVEQLGEGIRNMLARKTAHPTRAQIAIYYNQNKSLFERPERRDLEIVRAGSEAQALKIKGELASGRTFASVVSNLPLQPEFSKAGLVLGYEPGLYAQVPLDRAIFAAAPNVLSAPVHIPQGYYVILVKRVHRAEQESLAKARVQIEQTLPTILSKRALATWITAWRLRWRARTDCQAGYVVAKCKQSSTVGGEDPYTFN